LLVLHKQKFLESNFHRFKTGQAYLSARRTAQRSTEAAMRINSKLANRRTEKLSEGLDRGTSRVDWAGVSAILRARSFAVLRSVSKLAAGMKGSIHPSIGAAICPSSFNSTLQGSDFSKASHSIVAWTSGFATADHGMGIRSAGTLFICSGWATRRPKTDIGSFVTDALWVRTDVTMTTPSTATTTIANPLRMTPTRMAVPLDEFLHRLQCRRYCRFN
jgi:hypothetical protein